MKTIILGLDALILDGIFQPFAHWFQKLTGKDCFFLARTSSFVLLTTGLISDSFEQNHLRSPVIIAFSTPMTLMIFFVAWSCIALSQRFMDKANEGQAAAVGNPVRHMSRSVRMVVVGFWFLESRLLVSVILHPTIGESAGRLYLPCVIAILYFVACTPLPPAKSKIRVLLEKARSYLASVREPDLQPEPAGV